jgi:CBS domain containing-hemolysin-like protein
MDETGSHYVPMIISLAVLLGFSGFFSACEMAFSSLNRIKLKNLAVKSKRARLALKMLEVYDKILSTVLIGNNVVNIAASALATALFIGIFGAVGVSIATLVMTVLLLIFGDISPKALAKEMPELTALRAAPFLRVFMFLLTPINFLMTIWKKILLKIFPVKGDRGTTEDELLTFVEEVRQEGVINIQEEKMIRQVIEFDHLKASGIFTPRIDVEAIPDSFSIEEIDQKFMETGFSRLPVYNETIDNITGVLLLKDFYHKVMKGTQTLRQVIKPVVLVTKTIKLGKLLRTLQEKQSHMAVVVDEHGGTLGIVTIEDIVEELVGEIWDEHDEVIKPVRKNAGDGWTVLGSLSFQDMLEAITQEIAALEAETPDTDTLKTDMFKSPNPEILNGEPEDIPQTTVGNWIMENLGRLPKAGESLTWQHLKISVLRVIKQRVMEVKVTVNTQ